MQARALGAAAIVALALLACRPPCRVGTTPVCYTGPEGTDGVGMCRRGVLTCVEGRLGDECIGEVLPGVEVCDGFDNDCDGQIDEGLTNACGGCEALPGEPGQPCGACGLWACAGPDRLVCDEARPLDGTACEGDNGCPGSQRCVSPGKTACVPLTLNVCGLCGGPEISGLGARCEVDGCHGLYVCSPSGTDRSCRLEPPNNCGVCGAPAVPGVGDQCLGENGCVGLRVCNETNDGTTCSAPVRNACGICNGPEIAGLGEPCVGPSGCDGTLRCNAEGTGTRCVAHGGCAAIADHVVISEVGATSLAGFEDDFIELYNPTTEPILIEGYSLWFRNPAGVTFLPIATFESGTTIGPRGYLLLARAGGWTGITPDRWFTREIPHDPGGQLWLMREPREPGDIGGESIDPRDDPAVVDLLGYGSAIVAEAGRAAPLPGTGSLERKAAIDATLQSMLPGGTHALAGNGVDTDDNAADFIVRPERDPQNAASPPEPATTP